MLVAARLLVAMPLLLSPHICISLLIPLQRRPTSATQICVTNPTPASESDDSSPIQRKRRRRKTDSFFLTTQSTDESSTITTPSLPPTVEEDPSAANQLECPFAMKFPRYRVDLTYYKNSNSDPESEKRRSRRVQRGVINKLVDNLRTKQNDRNKDKLKSNEGNPWDAVSSIIKGLRSDTTNNSFSNRINQNNKLHKSVETRYATEKKDGLFRWISSAEMVETFPLADEDFVAAAAFWRMASDIAKQPPPLQQRKTWYLALPETTPTVASSLCDVLNWYANLLKQDDFASKQLIITAQLDSKSMDVPVIQFTAKGNREQHQSMATIPSAADTERRTKAWVTRLLVKLGVCPFTKSPEKSGQGLGDLGVPVANIMYSHSDALSQDNCGVYMLMADTWEAISDMVASGPSGKFGVSSILLSAPGFDDDFAFWAGPIFAMLEAGVSAIQAEEMIGVVCFHPKYVVPDGKSWPGFGQMHSLPRLKSWYNKYSSSSAETTIPLDDNEIAAGGAFQRRTPHAVINVLRAEQLEAAEGRRSTGELYERNIRVLMGKEGGLGVEKLTRDLKVEQKI